MQHLKPLVIDAISDRDGFPACIASENLRGTLPLDSSKDASWRATGNLLAFSPSQAAKVAGISRATLYRHIQSGALRTRKCGARTLILVEDLTAFLRSLPANTNRETVR